MPNSGESCPEGARGSPRDHRPGTRHVAAMLVKRGQKEAPPGGAWKRGCCCRRRLLLLLSLLLLQLPGTLAICFIQAQAPCLYQEKHFIPGESWLDANCSKCFCLHPLGVGCCETMQRPPVDFPDWCELRYDSQACTVSLVQKARPSLPCLNKLTKHLQWGAGELKSSKQGAETPPPPRR